MSRPDVFSVSTRPRRFLWAMAAPILLILLAVIWQVSSDPVYRMGMSAGERGERIAADLREQDHAVRHMMQILRERMERIESPDAMRSGIRELFHENCRRIADRGLTAPGGFAVMDDSGELQVWAGAWLPIAAGPDQPPVTLNRLPAGADLVYAGAMDEYTLQVFLPLFRESAGEMVAKDAGLFNRLGDRYGVSVQLAPAADEDGGNRLHLVPGVDLAWQSAGDANPSRLFIRTMGGVRDSPMTLLAVLALLMGLYFAWQPVPGWLRAGWALMLAAAAGIVTMFWNIPGNMPAFLSDPRIFAGMFPWPDLPWRLLLIAVIAWMAAAAVITVIPRRLRHGGWSLAAGLTVISLDPWIRLIGRTLIDGSSLAWWPPAGLIGSPGPLLILCSLVLFAAALIAPVLRFCHAAASPRKLPVTLLPAAAYALMMAVVSPAWSMGMFAPFILTVPLVAAAARIRKRDSSRFPGILLTGMLTAALLAPVLTGMAEKESRNTVDGNLRVWVRERDQLREFALRENLKNLRDGSDLIAFLTGRTSVSDFPAYRVWRAADISAVTPVYGVEIDDPGGELLDRFAPNLPRQPDMGQLVRRAVETPESPVIQPYHADRFAFEPDLTGAVAVIANSQPVGVLIIRLPAGPLSALPAAGEWGSRVRIYPVDPDGRSRLPEWEHSVDEAMIARGFAGADRWIDDPVNHRKLRFYPVSEHDSVRKWMLLAIMPDIPLSRWIAGGIRLALLGWILMAILTAPVLLGFRRPVSGEFWTFQKQILILFSVVAVVIPVFLTGIFQNMLGRYSGAIAGQEIRMRAGEIRDAIRDEAIADAREILSRIVSSPQIPADVAAMKWVILDARGGPRLVSDEPLTGEPSPAAVVRVFRDRTPATAFFRDDNGDSSLRITLPVDAAAGAGTFTLETPVTGALLNRAVHADITAVDLFAGPVVAVSSRPEMFNAGFLAPTIPESVDEAIRAGVLKENAVVRRFDHAFACYLALMTDAGTRAGILAVHGRLAAMDQRSGLLNDLAMITMALVLLTGMLLVTIIGRRLTRPIQHLADGAVRVAEGDLSSPVPRLTGGEIGHLIDSFNRMMQDLNKQRADLEARHQFISALMRNLSSGVAAVDVRNRIVTVNRAFCAMFDLDESALPGRNMDEVLNQLKMTGLIAGIRAFRDNRGAAELSCRLFSGGQVRHVRVGMARPAAAGEHTGDILMVFDDITDTVRSTKMQAYTELARRIAHEVKNPLTPIQLTIEHLRQTYRDDAPNFPQVFDTCTRMILDEVRSLEKIATEFSRFSRFPEPDFREADIRDLLREIAGIYSSPPDGLVVHVSEDDHPLMVRIDRDQMKRVLINLIQNALQAMRDTGGRVDIDASRDAGYVAIRIDDTGPGMDEETIMHLFEPYFSARQEGIGLGLVISKATVDAHQGRIHVTSVPGKGSRFTILLPEAGEKSP